VKHGGRYFAAARRRRYARGRLWPASRRYRVRRWALAWAYRTSHARRLWDRMPQQRLPPNFCRPLEQRAAVAVHRGDKARGHVIAEVIGAVLWLADPAPSRR
jgi:hypothetical protein